MFTLYIKSWCGYCRAAKQLLLAEGISFTEIDVTHDKEMEMTMRQLSGRVTVPQIFADQQHVGGYDELVIRFKNNPVSKIHL